MKEVKHLGEGLSFEFDKAFLIVSLAHGRKMAFLGTHHAHALGLSATLDFLKNMLTERATHIQLLNLCVVDFFTFS